VSFFLKFVELMNKQNISFVIVQIWQVLVSYVNISLKKTLSKQQFFLSIHKKESIHWVVNCSVLQRVIRRRFHVIMEKSVLIGEIFAMVNTGYPQNPFLKVFPYIFTIWSNFLNNFFYIIGEYTEFLFIRTNFRSTIESYHC